MWPFDGLIEGIIEGCGGCLVGVGVVALIVIILIVIGVLALVN